MIWTNFPPILAFLSALTILHVYSNTPEYSGKFETIIVAKLAPRVAILQGFSGMFRPYARTCCITHSAHAVSGLDYFTYL